MSELGRDALIQEGKPLFEQVKEEHWGFCLYTNLNTNTGEKSIPWSIEREIRIALALFVRKEKER